MASEQMVGILGRSLESCFMTLPDDACSKLGACKVLSEFNASRRQVKGTGGHGSFGLLTGPTLHACNLYSYVLYLQQSSQLQDITYMFSRNRWATHHYPN